MPIFLRFMYIFVGNYFRKYVKMLKPVRKSAKLFDNVLILLKNELYFVKWMVVGKLRLNIHFVTYEEAFYAVFFQREGGNE